jgi:hypothetical protein
MAYLVITEVALSGNPTTLRVWPARPPHDLGGARCAGLIFAAGAVAIALFGARTSGRHSGPE